MRQPTYPGYTICPLERLFNRGKKVKGLRGKKAKRRRGVEVKRLRGISIFALLPFCFFAFSPLLTGCAGVRSGTPVASELTGLPWMLQSSSGMVQKLSLEQIRDTLASENTKFTTLKAKAKIVVDAPATHGPLICNGYIRLQRPNKLRIICTKLISTVFDMLTDGEAFWLYLPAEKKVYTGRCSSINRLAKLDVNIHPNDIAMLLNYNGALTPSAILKKNGGVKGKSGERTFYPILETWPGLWLIHLVHLNNEAATLLANLYIDRVSVNVIRYDIFGINGNIRVQAVFDDYVRFDDSSIPQKITIFWPEEDTKLTLSLTNIAANEQINPKVFQFSKPKKAEIIFLDEM